VAYTPGWTAGARSDWKQNQDGAGNVTLNGRSVIDFRNAASRAAGLSILRRQPPSQRGPRVSNLAAVVADEDQRVRIGLEPLDGVVERVGEQHAPKLAVGHNIEADVELAPQRVADRFIFQLAQPRSVLLALRVLQGRVSGLIDPMDLFEEPSRAKQTPDLVGSRWNSRARGLRTGFARRRVAHDQSLLAV
jgi:hypothetical protein